MNYRQELGIWGSGQLLAFSALDGETDYTRSLTARTAKDVCGIDVELPARLRITFPDGSGAHPVVAGDFFETGNGVSGAFADSRHLLIEGKCVVEAPPETLTVRTLGCMTLIGTTDGFTPQHLNADVGKLIEMRSAWLKQLPSPLGKATPTFCKALSQMKTQICSPEGAIRHRWTTPDRWPHRKMWLWDSVFHAVGLRHFDTDLAKDAIAAVFDVQRDDGFIPHMSSPFECSEITQPPLLALGVLLVHEKAPSPAWIKHLYPKLKAYLEWDLSNRDQDGAGLLEWFIEGNPSCRCGESGADNSPRFDSAANLDAPDFNAFMAEECEIMSHFAEMLGLKSDHKLWLERQNRLNRLINERLWNENLGLYMDYDNRLGTQTDIRSYAAFMPLLCGAPSLEQARRLADQLLDPASFGSPLPVPTISPGDKKHYSKDMWRGPVWPSVNWLVDRGLRRYGFIAEADLVRERTMNAIECYYQRYGVLFEFFDDQLEVEPPALLRKGKNAPEVSPLHQVFHDYGWTAAVYLDFFLKDHQLYAKSQ